MKVGLVTVAYNEERFIKPFLQHIPDWVNEKLVLVSSKPWQGEPEEADGTADIARKMGARVIVYDWATEEAQRNAGQEYFYDYDWVIVLDPDEFLDDEGWRMLKYTIDTNSQHADANVVAGQKTYWKDGYVADPPRDYQMLILVKPNVRFVDKRVVGTSFATLPVSLHHFSWARTDKEIWSKISHYAHAKDFDIKDWYNNVWLKWKPGMKDVHPTTPETLHNLVKAKLPPEIERLKLWP